MSKWATVGTYDSTAQQVRVNQTFGLRVNPDKRFGLFQLFGVNPVCVSPVWVAPLVWVAPSVCRAPSVWAPSMWVGPLWVPPLLCLILST